MTLALVYRSVRRPAALGLAVAALVGAVLAASSLSDSANRNLLLAMVGALILFGAGGTTIVALRSTLSPRVDTVLFFLAGAAAAAVAGGIDNPMAKSVAVLMAVVAAVMCVLGTLLSAERSLDDPRSRF